MTNPNKLRQAFEKVPLPLREAVGVGLGAIALLSSQYLHHENKGDPHFEVECEFPPASDAPVQDLYNQEGEAVIIRVNHHDNVPPMETEDGRIHRPSPGQSYAVDQQLANELTINPSVISEVSTHIGELNKFVTDPLTGSETCSESLTVAFTLHEGEEDSLVVSPATTSSEAVVDEALSPDYQS